MSGWLKGFAAAFAAIVALGVVSSARAETVQFQTSGFFVAAGSDSVTAVNTTVGFTTIGPGALSTPTGSSGRLVLGFQGQSSTITTGALPSIEDLGQFALISTYTDPSTPVGFNAGDRFYLTITQTSPAGTGTSTATIGGSVSFTPSAPGGKNSGTITITFDPNPVYINVAGQYPYSYTLADQVMKFDVAQEPAVVGSTLQAQVAAVPLPATASTGLFLLGGLGLAGTALKVRQHLGLGAAA